MVDIAPASLNLHVPAMKCVPYHFLWSTGVALALLKLAFLCWLSSWPLSLPNSLPLLVNIVSQVNGTPILLQALVLEEHSLRWWTMIVSLGFRFLGDTSALLSILWLHKQKKLFLSALGSLPTFCPGSEVFPAINWTIFISLNAIFLSVKVGLEHKDKHKGLWGSR